MTTKKAQPTNEAAGGASDVERVVRYKAMVDEALDEILRAAGSGLKYYTMPATLEKMRNIMHTIMVANYLDGYGDHERLIHGLDDA